MNEEDLDQEISEALRGLPRERPVSQHQIAALAAKVKPPRRSWWMRDIGIAAAVAIVAFLSGRMIPKGGTADAQYMLLVHEDAPVPADAAAVYAEYSRWAGGLARRGQLVGGEELADDRILLAPGSGVRRDSASDTKAVGGYFLLNVGSEDEAFAIARDCPHLRRGGTVELRKIVRR